MPQQATPRAPQRLEPTRPKAMWARVRVPVVGKVFGIQHAMKGGVGTASVTVDGVTVGALIACNALGDVIDPTPPR